MSVLEKGLSGRVPVKNPGVRQQPAGQPPAAAPYPLQHRQMPLRYNARFRKARILANSLRRPTPTAFWTVTWCWAGHHTTNHEPRSHEQGIEQGSLFTISCRRTPTAWWTTTWCWTCCRAWPAPSSAAACQPASPTARCPALPDAAAAINLRPCSKFWQASHQKSGNVMWEPVQ